MFTRSNLFISAAALAGTTLLSACDGSVRREGPPKAELQVLRADAAGNRLWVLDEDAVTVYDNTNGRRLRRVMLPDWVVAGPGDSCPPSLALDASGAAFVSSNVVPVLWRVDPRRFQVTRIALELDADADKDVGFTSMSFSQDGALLAAGATFASAWRIDVGSGRASKVASSPAPGACDPAVLRLAARE